MRGLREVALGVFAVAAIWALLSVPAPADQVIVMPDADLAIRFPLEAGAPVRWEPRAAGNPPFGTVPANSVVLFADLPAAKRPVGPFGPPRAAVEWRTQAGAAAAAAVRAPFSQAFLAIHAVDELPCPPVQLAATLGFGPSELAQVLGATRWLARPRDKRVPDAPYEVVAWRTATHRFAYSRRGDAGARLVVRLQMPSLRPIEPAARFAQLTPRPDAP